MVYKWLVQQTCCDKLESVAAMNRTWQGISVERLVFKYLVSKFIVIMNFNYNKGCIAQRMCLYHVMISKPCLKSMISQISTEVKLTMLEVPTADIKTGDRVMKLHG